MDTAKRDDVAYENVGVEEIRQYYPTWKHVKSAYGTTCLGLKKYLFVLCILSVQRVDISKENYLIYLKCMLKSC